MESAEVQQAELYYKQCRELRVQARISLDDEEARKQAGFPGDDRSLFLVYEEHASRMRDLKAELSAAEHRENESKEMLRQAQEREAAAFEAEMERLKSFNNVRETRESEQLRLDREKDLQYRQDRAANYDWSEQIALNKAAYAREDLIRSAYREHDNDGRGR